MDFDIKKLEAIWTADSKKLGLAQYLLYRQDNINPDLQLYGSYLQVEDYEFGEVYYVPTDYIAGRDPDRGNVTLAVSFETVRQRTWFRMPDFIAHGEARKEFLPEE
jgi:hypothetical protein